MSFDTYKIVDATELDANLASIANKLKEKTGTSGSLVFPAGFNAEIDKLQYDADPNTASDISFSGDNVIVNEGYFINQTSKDMPTDYVGTGIARQAAQTITPTEEEQTAVAANTYTLGAITIGAIADTYVGSAVPTAAATIITPNSLEQTAITADTYATGEIKVAAIPIDYVGTGITRYTTQEEFVGDTPLTSFTDTFTIKAGYYPTDLIITYTAPVEEPTE